MPPFLPFDFTPDGLDASLESFFAHVQALGVNAVRLTLSWEGLEPAEGQRDATYWSRYRAMIAAADRHGLHVIVDFHQDAYASPFCGDGFPLFTLGGLPHGAAHYDCGFYEWALPYYDSNSVLQQAFSRLWNNDDGIRTKLGDMWRFVATDLAHDPGVAAFEPINEPGVGTGDRTAFEQTTLPAFYVEIADIIHEAAGRDVAILGGVPAGDATAAHHLVVPPVTSFVFAPHYYDGSAFLGLPQPDDAALAAGVATSIALPSAPDVPVIIGEYGMPNANRQKGDILDRMLDLFDAKNLSAMHWDAHVSPQLWNHEDFTVFAPDGSEQEWAGSLDRPFPRAIAGADVTFAFDRAATRFTMTVTGATDGVTEVYVPARRFGATPRVTATDARGAFGPDPQLLLLSATPGASYAVTVTR
jgi:endoglycosylceramidase